MSSGLITRYTSGSWQAQTPDEQQRTTQENRACQQLLSR